MRGFYLRSLNVSPLTLLWQAQHPHGGAGTMKHRQARVTQSRNYSPLLSVVLFNPSTEEQMGEVRGSGGRSLVQLLLFLLRPEHPDPPHHRLGQSDAFQQALSS
uniref:uncharacterized protein LOC128928571 isoform X1 n=1 Tax=Callithrix jacchus TaxID=9483 RepID=UPI0023DD120D|nr:uncharacterized protein LOC128928571 isoform X1 [Callithrix jacchus]